MKSTFNLLLPLLFSLTFNFSFSQNDPSYSLEYLVDIVGRTYFSPSLATVDKNMNFKHETVTSWDQKTQHLWYNTPISIFFTMDDVFGPDLRIIESIGFHLEEIKTGEYPMLENGFLGITAFMKRKKVDKIMLSIDPAYKNDGTHQAWADYKDDYRIKVQLTGEKSNSKVLRVYVYAKEDKLHTLLTKDFMENGPAVLLDQITYAHFEKMKEQPEYISIIPESPCSNCLSFSENEIEVKFNNGGSFKGKFSGGIGTDGIYNFPSNDWYDHYNGPFKNGEASGRGKLVSKDGYEIFGIWEKGQIKMVEFMEFDGYTYTGEVKPDFSLHGDGTVHAGNTSFKGEFKDGSVDESHDFIIINKENQYHGQINQSFQYHGKGKLTFNTGDFYEGTFAEGKFLGGQVIVTYQNGSTYKGLFNDNSEPDGKGSIKYANGNFVEGTFSHGKFLGGQGILKLSDGSTYAGEVNSKAEAEGQGKYSYSNGNYFNCTTKNGAFSNITGKQILDDGSIYTGSFNTELQMDGKGRVDHSSGTYISGTFSRGEFMGGTGFIKYQNNSAYSGEMDGAKNPIGKGTYYYTYSNDFIYTSFNKSGIIPGYGERNFADGTVFKGTVNNQGQPNGQGTAYFKNGVSVKGYFSGNRPSGTVTMNDGRQIWEGPVDDQYRPHGTGRFKSSLNGSWSSGTFSHGVRQ